MDDTDTVGGPEGTILRKLWNSCLELVTRFSKWGPKVVLPCMEPWWHVGGTDPGGRCRLSGRNNAIGGGTHQLWWRAGDDDDQVFYGWHNNAPPNPLNQVINSTDLAGYNAKDRHVKLTNCSNIFYDMQGLLSSIVKEDKPPPPPVLVLNIFSMIRINF